MSMDLQSADRERPPAPSRSARGQVLRRALRSDPGLEYLLCVPETAAPGGPLLVVVLGTTRRWSEQLALLLPLSRRHGVTLLAPSMQARRSSRRLGRDEGCGDVFLHECLREIGNLTCAETASFFLLGHSGGAQFAHRYAMALPHRVKAAVLAAAPWWSMPDPTRGFPYGIKRSSRLVGISFHPEQYLRVPMTAVVAANAQAEEPPIPGDKIAPQGATRTERARTWTGAMRAQALAFGMEPRVTLAETGAPTHGFEDLCRAGALLDIVDLVLESGAAQADRHHALRAGVRQ